MEGVTELGSRLRRPEYTGENRCTPCTVVNVVLAVVGTTAVGVAVGGQTGWGVAGGLLVASLASIYLRGYLVPGTPTLTKRYLPARVLAWFDKAPAESVVTDVDVEGQLVDAGVLEPCPDRDDLCLAAGFERAWHHRMDDRTAETVDLTPFMSGAERAAVDRAAVELDRVGAAYVAFVDDRQVAQWESRAAFAADRAAVELLADRVDEWPQLGFTARTELAGALRLWLDRCPTCGEPVGPGRDTVESCCREISVVAVECNQCDHRLFEVEFDAAEAPA